MSKRDVTVKSEPKDDYVIYYPKFVKLVAGLQCWAKIGEHVAYVKLTDILVDMTEWDASKKGWETKIDAEATLKSYGISDDDPIMQRCKYLLKDDNWIELSVMPDAFKTKNFHKRMQMKQGKPITPARTRMTWENNLKPDSWKVEMAQGNILNGSDVPLNIPIFRDQYGKGDIRAAGSHPQAAVNPLYLGTYEKQLIAKIKGNKADQPRHRILFAQLRLKQTGTSEQHTYQIKNALLLIGEPKGKETNIQACCLRTQYKDYSPFIFPRSHTCGMFHCVSCLFYSVVFFFFRTRLHCNRHKPYF